MDDISLLKQAAQAFREQRYSIAARIFYRLAKHKNNAQAQNELGICYARGLGMDQNDELAFKWFSLAAGASNMQALFNLGRCYETGTGVKLDLVRARELYEKSAKMGCANAKYACALLMPKSVKAGRYLRQAASEGVTDAIYLVGHEYLSTGDYENAVVKLKTAADSGHILAADELGLCYSKGWGVPLNADEAAKYFSFAARRGYFLANAHLGELKESESTTEIMRNTICKHYMVAASNGYSPAMVKLSRCYEVGYGVDKSPERALIWLRKAVQAGNPDAQYVMALHLLSGDIVPQDGESALSLLVDSARQNNADAFLKLAQLYSDVYPLPESALSYYQKAAYRGIAVAQYKVAMAYKNGKGVNADNKSYYFWLKKAAEGGCIEAQRSLAFEYLSHNDYSEYSPDAALSLLRITAASDAVSAMKLGELLLEGTAEVEKDLSTAIQLLKGAAAAGVVDANLRLGLCYSEGKGVPCDNKIAVQYYLAASKLGSVRAVALLGICLADGSGLKKNSEKSFVYLQTAATKGDVLAMYHYGRALCDAGKAGLEWIQKAADSGFKEAVFYLFDKKIGDINIIKQQLTQLVEQDANKDAMERLAALLLESNKAEDRQKAVEYLEKLADDDLSVKLILADLYARGDGCRANPFRAFELFAEQADTVPYASFRLGSFYEFGIATSFSLRSALIRYKNAAEMGLESAQWVCAEFYLYGKTCKPNVKTALSYIQPLAQAGDARAQYMLYSILSEHPKLDKDGLSLEWLSKAVESGYPKAIVTKAASTSDKAEAFALLQKAALQSEPSCYIKLAECFELGYGTEVNPEAAFANYLFAALSGNAEAMIKTAEWYAKGLGVEKSPQDAYFWYVQAALNGKSALPAELPAEVG